jgi:hypothetical protein
MCQPSVVDTWRTVSFWTENLTEVLIRYFSKTEVLSVMRIEIYGLKNKVYKTQGPEAYLTLFIKQTDTKFSLSELGPSLGLKRWAIIKCSLTIYNR